MKTPDRGIEFKKYTFIAMQDTNLILKNRLFYFSNPDTINFSYINTFNFDTIINFNLMLYDYLSYKLIDTTFSVYLKKCDNSIFTNSIDKTKLKVYPNPANNKLTIDLGYNSENETISIYNLQAICIKKITPLNSRTITIDISDWADGLYIVKTKSETKKFQIIK